MKEKPKVLYLKKKKKAGMLTPFKEGNTSFHLLPFLFRCQLICPIPGEQGTPHVPMWHVAFSKHSLIAGIFDRLVGFSSLFWQALPNTAILVQGKSVVATLCSVLFSCSVWFKTLHVLGSGLYST